MFADIWLQAMQTVQRFNNVTVFTLQKNQLRNDLTKADFAYQSEMEKSVQASEKLHLQEIHSQNNCISAYITR